MCPENLIEWSLGAPSLLLDTGLAPSVFETGFVRRCRARFLPLRVRADGVSVGADFTVARSQLAHKI